jgi:predicted PurR-regulated permease PerM
MEASAITESRPWLGLAALTLTAWLVYLLAPILTPFVAGALLAYVTDPLADRLESKGLTRIWSVVIVFLSLIVASVVAVLVIAPTLEQQIENLIDNLPALTAWTKSTALPWLRDRFGIRIKLNNLDQISGLLGQHWQQAGGIAATLFSSLSHSGVVVLHWVMNLLLIPVVTFYLLRDWDLLVAKFHDLLPRRYTSTVGRLALESDAVLSAFLRGQFTVMLALAAIYSLGLYLIGLDLALLIGFLAGMLSFVPYMGVIVGLGSGCLAAISQFGDIWAVIPVLVVFGIGQLLEGMVLTPKLVGDRVGLHPVAVIFAVLAGGQLFGFLGVLLALPAASVVMVLLRHVHDLYKDSDLYGDGAKSVTAAGDGGVAEEMASR